ncbi:kinesin-like protein KIF15 isoform X2 [Rhopilema esculentum]|uniref:kinesin-like protein KIF15 isoform X2 n=1 Tax=Rhopilema esculentum TaxID=499914 RepID=UPI0031DE157F
MWFELQDRNGETLRLEIPEDEEMNSNSTSRSGTPKSRRRSRSNSVSSSQSSVRPDTRVQVFVRARPSETSFATEPSESASPLEFPSDREIKLIDPKQETTYRFDHVFPPSTTNKEVCRVISTPLIESVLQGYNGSFMVYGQTGTGKTFTVQAEDGLIHTTIASLFERIHADKDFEFSVNLSYLQIYHERIYDLLDSAKDTDLHLREHPEEGIMIEGLSECIITSTKDAESLLEYGRRQLYVAETKMVRSSSRSHSMCILRVQKKKSREAIQRQLSTETAIEIDPDALSVGESFLKGKLYLCDLAGSERLKKSGVSGERWKEARYINTSLLELGNVIHALSTAGTHHVPFRNSTLTRILKESLGGNSRASLMICVSSSIRFISETKCSLNFGQRALRVTKTSSPNIEPSEEASDEKTDLKTIDYKALSEYLAKKLKELELAYHSEKQHFKKMQDELKKGRKGPSKIPVLAARSRTPTPRHDSFQLMEDIFLAECDELEEIERYEQLSAEAQEKYIMAPGLEEESRADAISKQTITSHGFIEKDGTVDRKIAGGAVETNKHETLYDLAREDKEKIIDGNFLADSYCQTDENSNYLASSEDANMHKEIELGSNDAVISTRNAKKHDDIVKKHPTSLDKDKEHVAENKETGSVTFDKKRNSCETKQTDGALNLQEEIDHVNKEVYLEFGNSETQINKYALETDRKLDSKSELGLQSTKDDNENQVTRRISTHEVDSVTDGKITNQAKTVAIVTNVDGLDIKRSTGKEENDKRTIENISMEKIDWNEKQITKIDGDGKLEKETIHLEKEHHTLNIHDESSITKKEASTIEFKSKDSKVLAENKAVERNDEQIYLSNMQLTEKPLLTQGNMSKEDDLSSHSEDIAPESFGVGASKQDLSYSHVDSSKLGDRGIKSDADDLFSHTDRVKSSLEGILTEKGMLQPNDNGLTTHTDKLTSHSEGPSMQNQSLESQIQSFSSNVDCLRAHSESLPTENGSVKSQQVFLPSPGRDLPSDAACDKSSAHDPRSLPIQALGSELHSGSLPTENESVKSQQVFLPSPGRDLPSDAAGDKSSAHDPRSLPIQALGSELHSGSLPSNKNGLRPDCEGLPALDKVLIPQTETLPSGDQGLPSYSPDIPKAVKVLRSCNENLLSRDQDLPMSVNFLQSSHEGFPSVDNRSAIITKDTPMVTERFDERPFHPQESTKEQTGPSPRLTSLDDSGFQSFEPTSEGKNETEIDKQSLKRERRNSGRVGEEKESGLFEKVSQKGDTLETQKLEMPKSMDIVARNEGQKGDLDEIDSGKGGIAKKERRKGDLDEIDSGKGGIAKKERRNGDLDEIDSGKGGIAKKERRKGDLAEIDSGKGGVAKKERRKGDLDELDSGNGERTGDLHEVYSGKGELAVQGRNVNEQTIETDFALIRKGEGDGDGAAIHSNIATETKIFSKKEPSDDKFEILQSHSEVLEGKQKSTVEKEINYENTTRYEVKRSYDLKISAQQGEVIELKDVVANDGNGPSTTIDEPNSKYSDSRVDLRTKQPHEGRGVTSEEENAQNIASPSTPSSGKVEQVPGNEANQRNKISNYEDFHQNAESIRKLVDTSKETGIPMVKETNSGQLVHSYTSEKPSRERNRDSVEEEARYFSDEGIKEEESDSTKTERKPASKSSERTYKVVESSDDRKRRHYAGGAPGTTNEDVRVAQSLDDSSGSNGEYKVLDSLICSDNIDDVKEALIVKNNEETKYRPISIGEPRIISPKREQALDFLSGGESFASVGKQVALHRRKADGGQSQPGRERQMSREELRLSLGDALSPRQLSISPTPSSTSMESDFSLALKEKDKLQKALSTVKGQYEDMLQEFDKIIANNTTESGDDNVQISKESYKVALKCKEELELEIRKAREQLAMVQAVHEEQSESLLWHASDFEYSEDGDSFCAETTDDGMTCPLETSTPVPYIDTKVIATGTSPAYRVEYKSNAVQTDDESVSDYNTGERTMPVLKEIGTNTSPESDADSVFRRGHSRTAETNTFEDEEENSLAMRQSELERLPATLPRRRGSKRRSKGLEEWNIGGAKWLSRRSLVSKEQAKKTEKLTLQAIENAELKKELLLTKLEKIRLEAMLSCVMMRLSPTEVERDFRKISLNSITSSASTLRSTSSLTNIAQGDQTSPFQPTSPFRRLNPRLGTSMIGDDAKSSQQRVRFEDSRKTPSSTVSARSSSLFGHSSLLTQSSMSPSSMDFDLSSYVSTDFGSTPVPMERVSPCGQDGDDKYQSPSSTKGKEKKSSKDSEMVLAYSGKNKLLLSACLPFRKKKKGGKDGKRSSQESKDESYGSNC